MSETTQAPRTEAEREAMVAEEARRECEAVKARILAAGCRQDDDCRGLKSRDECPACWKGAEAAIPPVSPAPALVTADAYVGFCGWNGDVLATLRHYEAEVGRLEEARKEVAAERHWLMEQEAREAPFAALGRKVATMPTTAYLTKDHELMVAARAALAEEAKAKEPEVVTGPSGWRYRVRGEGIIQVDHCGNESFITDGPGDDLVPPCDAPVVAALLKGVTLMESKGGKDVE